MADRRSLHRPRRTRSRGLIFQDTGVCPDPPGRLRGGGARLARAASVAAPSPSINRRRETDVRSSPSGSGIRRARRGGDRRGHRVRLPRQAARPGRTADHVDGARAPHAGLGRQDRSAARDRQLEVDGRQAGDPRARRAGPGPRPAEPALRRPGRRPLPGAARGAHRPLPGGDRAGVRAGARCACRHHQLEPRRPRRHLLPRPRGEGRGRRVRPRRSDVEQRSGAPPLARRPVQH